MKYIYGPIKSRRLGLSLGVSLIPHKTCSFDCVYCQLGKTLNTTNERKEYLNIEEVLGELKEALRHLPSDNKLDYITFSGFGEPTLNINIGKMIKEIRAVSNVALALITNSASLVEAKVRKEVLGVDLIVPSLDAVTQDTFEKIDRPAAGIRVEDVINGLIELRREFKGEIYLEIMFIKDINDGLDYALRFKKVVDRINPDRLQMNIPVRSVVEKWAVSPDVQRLKQIKEILGPKAELI